MTLQIDVNNVKSTIFLEMLKLFKQDNMINDYKIIDNDSTNYDLEVINDISNIKIAFDNANIGLGTKTTKTVSIKD
jgi:uncharacterized membrane protein YjjP (DUF1212 family)